MPDQTVRDEPFSTIYPELLTTKLYPPTVTAAMEPRPELVAWLEGNRHRALTLISAPAGYGKSVLASMWLDASDAPGCWVSLDENDDDPRTFLGYVIAALQSASPETAFQTQQLADGVTFPPPQAVARMMLNDLEQLPQRILLVLDDLHVIRNRIVYDFLTELLRHPSPQMHLVLITRRDPPLPISSLRAYGMLTEIRAQDLRFSSAHTAGLLTRMLRREVDEATAAAWTERTEGWAMALNLAAVAMRQRDQLEVHLDHVPVDSHFLREYLLAEVVGRLDPTLRAWLSAVAWVDRFCPALCAAVVQPDDAAAEAELTSEEFVQRLCRENLFVTPLDSENRWFRFHHLFQEHLRNWGRNQCQQDEIALFHQRAGAWYAREGLIDEALRHLVLAGDLVGAEELVLRHRYELMNTEQWHRLERWLHYFPDSAVEQNGLLTSTVVILAVHSGDWRRIVVGRQRAKQLLTDLAPDSNAYQLLLGEYSATTAFLALGNDNAEELITSAQTALELLPPDALHVRAMASGLVAMGLQMCGQFARGYRHLNEALNERSWTRPIQNNLMAYQCMVCYVHGNLGDVINWAETVFHTSTRLLMSESLCHARYFLGVVHYLQGEYDAAEPYLSALVEDRATSAPTYVAMGAFALTLIRAERGDTEHADAVIDRITAHFRQIGESSTLDLIEAFAVELALRRGDLGAAQSKQVGVDFDSRPPLWFFYIPQLTPVKLLLKKGTPEALAAARSTLEEFEERMRNIHRNAGRVQALVLLAVVCDAQGDAACADASLTAALTLAEAGQLIRPFVDVGPPMAKLLQRLLDRDGDMCQATRAFVSQILAAFPISAPAHVEPRMFLEQAAATRVAASSPPGLLTAREMQILQLLATDRTPAEIAAQNIVSITTVRSQIKSIYRKLDVNSRMEAVNRGRELNLL